MEAYSRFLTLLPTSLIAALASQPVAAQQMMEFNESELIRSLLPSVVNITATLPGSTQSGAGSATNAAAAQPQTEKGSGFVIDPSGLIATNDHVIHGAYWLQVMFSDGQTAPARLVATAPTIDIAVIKVETQHALVAVRWGDSDKLQIGDSVIAIGNALGLGMAVSSGVVSALNKNIDASPFDDYIQTDASINHGNSGGPLFNTAGEVIGMDTALISPTSGSVGVGFAQPSDDVKLVTERLILDGWPKPGWIGSVAEDVTPELAQALGMQSPRGQIIASLKGDGPAAAAGLRIGDIVLRFGDRTPGDIRELRRLVAWATVGQTVPVAVLRDGQEIVFQVTIKQWPLTAAQIRADSTQAAAPPVTVPPGLGLTLNAITDEVRTKYGLDAAQAGVVIEGISAGTDAATRGLSPGDVILRVQTEQVQTPQQVQEAIDAARTQHRPYVAALVQQKARGAAGAVWIALRVTPL
jgi:serine protease Do